MNELKMREEFKDPSKQYRPMPFWFWNFYLEDEEIIRQVGEIKRNGLGGFIIHARHGMKLPYLSEEWFRKCRVAIEEAEKLDLSVWIYDEEGWPSGTAGGRVISSQPQYRMSFIFLAQEFHIQGPFPVEKEIHCDDGLLSLVAVQISGGVLRGVPENVIDLTPHLHNGKLRWTAPPGNWKILVIVRKIYRDSFWGGEEFNLRRGYIDVLNKNAVGEFIRLTHQTYVEHFREYLGTTVRGFFTDEPSLNYSNSYAYNWGGTAMKAIPWTPNLFSEFLSMHHYDLKDWLPAIFHDIGADTAKVRCDYYQTVTAMYRDAFFEQIYDYCEKNNLLFIGHVLSEGELYPQVRNQGDYFQVARYMHYGGCDQLTDQTWPGDSFHTNNLVGPKFASSAAHLAGKPRVMSESFGVSGEGGWSLELNTLKKLADWQIALGINYFVPHALFYSIFGFRKWESPPCHYHATFWKYYRYFADYVARLCYLFSGGRHVARVAILAPIKTVWSQMTPDDNPQIRQTWQEFNRVSAQLLKVHYDYDYLSEELLQQAVIEDGKIKVRDEKGQVQEEFEVLILPAVITLSRQSLTRMKEFCKGGGTIIATGTLPRQSAESGPAEDFCQAVDELFQASAAVELNPGECTYFLPALAGPEKGKAEASFRHTLARCLKRDVSIEVNGEEAEEIIYLHRIRDGGEIYFLANTSEDKGYSTQVTLGGTGKVEIWDAATGEVSGQPESSPRTEGISFGLEFPPLGSFVVVLSRRSDIEPKKMVRFKPKRDVNLSPVELAEKWSFATERPNALPLRDWKYHTGVEVTRMSGFPLGLHRYETSFYLEHIPEDLKLLMDGILLEKVHYAIPSLRESVDHGIKIYLNGKRVLQWQHGTYLDRYIEEFAIGELVQMGENRICVEAVGELFETPNLSDPFFVTGSFCLRCSGEQKIIEAERGRIKSGSWVEQGYLYYAGTGIYEQTVDLQQGYRDVKLELELDKVAEMVEVWVNGKEVAFLGWPPFRADITDYLQAGENKIALKVTNTLQNLLFEEPKASGILGGVRIVPYYEEGRAIGIGIFPDVAAVEQKQKSPYVRSEYYIDENRK